MRNKYITGIDEAGRGPIAGPVAVGVVIMKLTTYNQRQIIFRGIRDSKQLTEKKREWWFGKIKKLKKEKILDFRVSLVSEKTIDEKGIVFAIRKGIYSSLLSLKVGKDAQILLDGSLKAPARYKYQKTIIRGDEKKPVISAASIMAKVVRDRHMKKIAEKHPDYAFEKHKGYGTKEHYRRIKKHGLSKIHRRSFLGRK
ncbi:MAG: ribonuclease HII [Patescibacteria group bacterium]